MPPLLTLDQALAHLKYPPAASLAAEDLADLQLKLDGAHELVLDYVDQQLGDGGPAWSATVAAWTDTTAPKRVLMAILEILARADAKRGDEDPAPTVAPGQLPPYVITLLNRLRDPGIAVPAPASSSSSAPVPIPYRTSKGSP
jgi:hypothetical protein